MIMSSLCYLIITQSNKTPKTCDGMGTPAR